LGNLKLQPGEILTNVNCLACTDGIKKYMSGQSEYNSYMEYTPDDARCVSDGEKVWCRLCRFEFVAWKYPGGRKV